MIRGDRRTASRVVQAACEGSLLYAELLSNGILMGTLSLLNNNNTWTISFHDERIYVPGMLFLFVSKGMHAS